jgi:beta-lactamase regulating signal transducer with metallopeptidase domain
MYILFLRKETFFKANRLYLILGLISSFIFPLITFTKTVWVESQPVFFSESIGTNSISIENASPIEKTFNWNEILFSAYLLISILVLMKILVEVVSFFKSIQNQDRKNEEKYTLINSSEHENPFSFFNFIVINPQKFSEEELSHILIHESIHVKQKHSLDVLFSRIICAILWINPVIWLYRKAIIQNLEYIADHETFLTINNKHAYQKTLLKVVISNNQSAITNQFFQSLIKKRIVMLNTNQSHKKKSWKYAVILPFLIAFTLLFQIETVAQAKETKVEETTYAVSSSYSSILTKNTSDQEIKELEKAFSDEKQKLIISNVKRNSNNEIIAIKLEFDFGKTYNRVMERKSDKGINSIKIYINSDEDDDLAYGFEDVDITPIEVILVEEKKPTEKHLSMDNLTRNGKEIVLIINGKIKDPEEKVTVDLDDELGDMKEISASEFEKKYNKKADRNKLYYEVNTVKMRTVTGSYYVTAKTSEEKEKESFLNNYMYLTSDSKKNVDRTKEKNAIGNNVFYETVVSYETSRPEEKIERLKKNKSVDYRKALIIYDGKEINYSDFEKIDPLIITVVSVLSDTEYAIKKYDEKGKNGVIVIESKNYYEKNNPNAKINKEYEAFNIKEENEGFIITKNSREEDLTFYKSKLAKSNIEFKYSGIRRNEKGEITSISINLKQRESKIKRNIKTNDPIPSLFIGMKKGSIVVEETK